MSYQLLKNDILFYQRFLKSNGFYNGALDGLWGPKTNKADTDFVALSVSIAGQYGTFDNRSETNIITLIPDAQIEARRFLKWARNNNKRVKILSCTRTYAEQDTLYSQGRNGNPPPVITNAKGGQSNHNFGVAWDIGLFNNDGSYNTNDNDYKAFARLILSDITAIDWGGNWTSFKDYPHYQLKSAGDNVTAIRQLFESGQAYA
jgi:peptidoglycan L-alanyl-D-glutamate endopeptidase CwlK